MASAGRILIKPKGDWNAETEYGILDLVKHDGKVWLAKEDVVGIEPTDASENPWYNMFDIKSGTTLVTLNPGNKDYIEATLDVPYGSKAVFSANVRTSDDLFVVGVNVLEISASQTKILIKLNQAVNKEITLSVGWSC